MSDIFLKDAIQCPHCAYTGLKMARTEVGRYPHQHFEYWVECQNCGACGPNDLGRSGAVHMWNLRRTEFPTPEALP